jgi:glycosyltransferase involved in cell wall biosynthesis
MTDDIPLDIVIPVFNEAENIIAVLEALRNEVSTPFRVQICYDHEDDNTLPVLRDYHQDQFELVLTRNEGQGPHGAVTTGFRHAVGRCVLVFPADDTFNANIIDTMYDRYRTDGCHVVAASRFMKGGSMRGCPWLKSFLVRFASFTLHYLAFIPIKDASNGFRLFSKELLQATQIESTLGFTYSIELLVKCHRYRWGIAEVPAQWIEREAGESSFKLFKWLPHYLKWYFYGFRTTYLRLKEDPHQDSKPGKQ